MSRRGAAYRRHPGPDRGPLDDEQLVHRFAAITQLAEQLDRGMPAVPPRIVPIECGASDWEQRHHPPRLRCCSKSDAVATAGLDDACAIGKRGSTNRAVIGPAPRQERDASRERSAPVRSECAGSPPGRAEEGS